MQQGPAGKLKGAGLLPASRGILVEIQVELHVTHHDRAQSRLCHFPLGAPARPVL